MACLLMNGHITLLAPLYMRCSIDSPAMVAAGPGMNVLAGLISLVALRIWPGRGQTARYFFWLCLIFNWLVASGYLLVGAVTTFGDWGVLFAGVRPAWAWRLPAIVIALCAYSGAITCAKKEFHRFDNPDSFTRRALARVVLIPTGAAAAIAVIAECYGQGARLWGLMLALGCTLCVGLTVMGIGGATGTRTIENSFLRIEFSTTALALGVAVAAAFILCIGPGADLSAL